MFVWPITEETFICRMRIWHQNIAFVYFTKQLYFKTLIVVLGLCMSYRCLSHKSKHIYHILTALVGVILKRTTVDQRRVTYTVRVVRRIKVSTFTGNLYFSL